MRNTTLCDTTRHQILLVVVALLATFIFARGHYHFSGVEKFEYADTDSIWMYAQQTLNKKKSIGQSILHPYQEARDNIRPGIEKTYFKILRNLSNYFKISLYSLNKLSASVIFFGFLLTLLWGAKTIFGNSNLVLLLFVFSVSQSAAVNWLRYPTFVPKTLGFLMFPLLLFSWGREMSFLKRVLYFLVSFSLMAILYPPAAAYVLPPLFFAMIVKATFAQTKVKESLIAITGLVIFAVGILLSLKKPTGLMAPPLKAITELVYLAHKFDLNTFKEYIFFHWIYFIFAILSYYFLYFKKKKVSFNVASYFLAFYIFAVAWSIFTHVLADQIDFIRLTWLWRTHYFGFIPAIVVIFLALKEFLQDIEKSRKLVVAISVTALFVVVFERSNPIGTYLGISNFVAASSGHKIATNLDELNRFKQLINFSKNTPKDSVFIMSRRSSYVLGDAYFEIESDRTLLLSDLERPLFIGVSPITKEIAQNLQIHKQFYSLHQPTTLNKLEYLARKMKATHIILDNDFLKKHNLFSPNTIYKDSFWTLIATGARNANAK